MLNKLCIGPSVSGIGLWRNGALPIFENTVFKKKLGLLGKRPYLCESEAQPVLQIKKFVVNLSSQESLVFLLN